ncbi:hypothetical protein [Streptomyces muensis]|uniref:Uncharacterized protein n=1 Tax=Streptomyces muensis TaxID=1077944 RepID=A0A9X1Q6A7_STRM4|nr:hypothetical protein [Streptomyces muensis]MCF1599423.1 hypothetical protein [Streptomyces muensis]
MKQPVERARDIALRVLGAVTSAAVPEVTDLAEVVRRFEGVEFDVPAEGDTDGFLFEYCCVNWLSEPTFVLGFTRQLGLVGDEGSVDAYVQIQFDYRYPCDSELSRLKSSNTWWFRADGTSFAEWLDAALRDPVWDAVRQRNPIAFDVTEDFV